MASAWSENGPVSLPPKSLAYGAAAVLAVLAIAGVGLGLRAAWRESGVPDLAGGSTQSDSSADVLTARPIVDLPAPPANADVGAENQASAEAKDQAKADAIAEKTAAAQEVQAQPSKPAANIDQILTSPSEKPTPPAKPTADEAPPAPPVKSDVPF